MASSDRTYTATAAILIIAGSSMTVLLVDRSDVDISEPTTGYCRTFDDTHGSWDLPELYIPRDIVVPEPKVLISSFVMNNQVQEKATSFLRYKFRSRATEG